MNNVLKLSFLTNTNALATLNIRNPFLDVSDIEVKDAMAKIIGSEAILVGNAFLARMNGAQLLTVTEQKFDI
jgi:hypothetical protein